MDIQIDISDTVLETERLLLRPWQAYDLHDFYEYASVDGVGEMAGWAHHQSIFETKKILDSFISQKNVFAIVFKENNKVIGSLGFHPSWANGEPEYLNLRQKEIGYVLSKEYWSRGLMTEAVKKVIEYCFQSLELDAVTVGHFKNNDMSRRVIEKCGFIFVNESKYYAKQLDKYFDDMRYILINHR